MVSITRGVWIGRIRCNPTNVSQKNRREDFGTTSCYSPHVRQDVGTHDEHTQQCILVTKEQLFGTRDQETLDASGMCTDEQHGLCTRATISCAGTRTHPHTPRCMHADTCACAWPTNWLKTKHENEGARTSNQSQHPRGLVSVDQEHYQCHQPLLPQTPSVDMTTDIRDIVRLTRVCGYRGLLWRAQVTSIAPCGKVVDPRVDAHVST